GPAGGCGPSRCRGCSGPATPSRARPTPRGPRPGWSRHARAVAWPPTSSRLRPIPLIHPLQYVAGIALTAHHAPDTVGADPGHELSARMQEGESVKFGVLRRLVVPVAAGCLVAAAPAVAAPPVLAAGTNLGYTFDSGTEGFTAPTWLSANA